MIVFQLQQHGYVAVIIRLMTKSIFTFSATDSESISCQLTLISALKVTHKPEQGSQLNCFKNGSYQVTLEKTDKVGFDWQE